MLAVPTRPAALLAVAATAFLTPQPSLAQSHMAAPSPQDAPPPTIARDATPRDAPPQPPADGLDPASPMAPLPGLEVDWPTIAPADQPVTGAAAVPTAPAVALRRYRVVLAGVDDLPEFRSRFDQLSELRDGDGKPANAAQIERRTADDQDLATEILRSIGRYDATVASKVDAAGHGEIVVTLTIDPGPAYHFTGVDLPGLDAGGAPARALAADFAVKRGEVVDTDRVNTAVQGFQTNLRNRGYPFATVAEAVVTIDHNTHDASLSAAVALGSKARFGRIVVLGPKPLFSARHVAVIARFHPGEPYDARRLDDLRRALIATGLVSVADVHPQKNADPQLVDIAVRLERAPRRTIAAQLGYVTGRGTPETSFGTGIGAPELGYGTGQGVRAEVSWQNRNLIKPEGAVTFRGVAGTREQSLSATLRQNNFYARDRALTAQIAAAHVVYDAYDARTFAISAGLERQSNIIFQKKWSWSLGTEFVATDERDTILSTGLSRRRTFLVAALPGSIGYDCTDDLLNPTRCFRVALHVSPEVSLQSGAHVYVKSQFDGSVYLPITGRTVLAGRVRFGSIYGTPLDNIAPSRRFYAGGGGSVRGFGYQDIGPTDVNGVPVGGRGLTEFGLEARVRFGNFGIVPFLDAGNLYSSSLPKFTAMRFGTGLGVRYYSSFGPIRVDLGTPIHRRHGESRLAIYVSLGQAF